MNKKQTVYYLWHPLFSFSISDMSINSSGLNVTALFSLWRTHNNTTKSY